MAHEVKNPLTLVKANIDLLESNDEKLDHKKNYNMIRNELNKINDLMLEFINIMQPANVENYDFIYIYDILHDIIQKYSETYKDKLSFNLNVQSTDIYILGNEKNIQILFNNLIKNSLEAIETNGNITINIQLDKSNNNIVITIKDNGVGIPKDLECKIHEDFFTTKEFGSGLGISICQKVVQDHKGTFTLINNEDIGCTAKVTLPLYKRTP